MRYVYTVLRDRLDGAVRDGLLARNPAAPVKRPDIARREAKHVETVDVAKRLYAEGLRYRNTLVAGTGMRRGEVLALHWSDLDLETRTAAVRGTLGRVGGLLIIAEPKTERSRRSVPLSAPLEAMLRAHRADQEAERHAAGV
jgi:integrase